VHWRDASVTRDDRQASLPAWIGTLITPGGENTLATGASPRGHHGMEVNWPGIMVLIRYRTEAE